MGSPSDSPIEPVGRNTMLYSVVVPAYNEEANITATVSRLADALRAEAIPFELVVVNDGSADRTRDAVMELSIDYPEARIVDNALPRGFGRAVRRGLTEARGEAVTLVMADLSDSPEDVVRCYRKLEEGWDCVFGSRFVKGGRVTAYPGMKLFVNRIVNHMLNLLFGAGHNDLTNAFKVYRRHVLQAIGPLQASHFNITIELSLSALIRNYRIATIPISWTGRTWGQSNLRLGKMGRRYLCTMLKLYAEKLLVRDDLLAERGVG